ncbi:integrase core domain-containing protein [Nocardia sp. NPDC051990]|uniref:integrase core domain-containing protein n=1 Tax=Nocardia sp. NPDC051990 TaxID=3155285 RepID=UPI0034478DFE
MLAEFGDAPRRTRRQVPQELCRDLPDHPPVRQGEDHAHTVRTQRPPRRRRAHAGRTFASVREADRFCRAFFTYYNTVHRHSGIGLHTPATVRNGTAVAIRAEGRRVLITAYTANPIRFRQPPTPAPGAEDSLQEPDDEASLE